MENNRLPEQPVVNLVDTTYEYEPGVGVYDLNLSVPPGSIFGLIGPSGCGKTTTIRILLGLLNPQHGSTYVLDEDSSRLSGRSREKLGYLPQRFVLYPNLTVEENLSFVASIYGMPIRRRGERIRELLEVVELSDAQGRLASDLSGGMRTRLELAASLLHSPELVFADEPTSGIDPVLRSKLWGYLRDYRDKGNTLFVTTQYVGEATYCDVVGVMIAGRLVHVETPENLYRQALGGEVIVVTVDPACIERVRWIIQNDERIQNLHVVADDPGSLQITVENSGEMIPQILDMLASEPDIEVYNVNRYEPPFDEIFTRLVEGNH